MFRRSREEFSFWPALTDFILAILLLVVILWIADAGMRAAIAIRSPRLEPGQIAIFRSDWERCRIIKDGMEIVPTTDLEGYKRRIKELEDELKQRPDKPLVFPLEEASGFAFAPGKAELPPEFVKNLREVILPKIAAIVSEFKIEIMEVVGHTDGQPIRQGSNLDEKLNGFLVTPGAEITIQSLKFDSNADLGLARALAVTSFLQSEFAYSRNTKLSELTCRAYSGAQIISPITNAIEGALNEDDPSRRRIELRFTRNPTPKP
jgi:outer membrane protein OmpA-like peptidoglycan-associated protein